MYKICIFKSKNLPIIINIYNFLIHVLGQFQYNQLEARSHTYTWYTNETHRVNIPIYGTVPDLLNDPSLFGGLQDGGQGPGQHVHVSILCVLLQDADHCHFLLVVIAQNLVHLRKVHSQHCNIGCVDREIDLFFNERNESHGTPLYYNHIKALV